MGEVELFAEKCHPDAILTTRPVHIFNDNAMMHFRNILLCRQKQLTHDKFLVKKARKATTEEEESTASKRQRREETQSRELASLFMVGDSPKKRV